jgi:molybdenum cofactor synthesis domain-containing protein
LEFAVEAQLAYLKRAFSNPGLPFSRDDPCSTTLKSSPSIRALTRAGWTQTRCSYRAAELDWHRVELKTIVGDNENVWSKWSEAVKRSALVIATGGLGPTEDDVTKKVFARVLKRQMVLDDEILERIKARFRRRGLEMPANNARQALVPVGGRILENPAGTAPGIWMETEGCEVILLPGPPSELKSMFEECCMSAGGTGGRRPAIQAGVQSYWDYRIEPG